MTHITSNIEAVYEEMTEIRSIEPGEDGQVQRDRMRLIIDGDIFGKMFVVEQRIVSENVKALYPYLFSGVLRDFSGD